MEDTILTFGPYVLPFPIALATFLSIFYSLFNQSDGTNILSDRFKNAVALVLGMGFGILVMLQKGLPVTVPNFVGWAVFGLLEGAAAVGLYKSVKVQAGK